MLPAAWMQEVFLDLVVLSFQTLQKPCFACTGEKLHLQTRCNYLVMMKVCICSFHYSCFASYSILRFIEFIFFPAAVPYAIAVLLEVVR